MSNRLLTAVESLFEKQNFSKPSVWALIIANLYPVIGVIFFNWQTYPLLLFFWSENLVIGFYTVIKIAGCIRGECQTGSKIIRDSLLLPSLRHFHPGARCFCCCSFRRNPRK